MTVCIALFCAVISLFTDVSSVESWLQESEIILVHGGDKGSQSRDIALARKKLVAMTQEVV